MSEHITRPTEKDIRLIKESLDKACAYNKEIDTQNFPDKFDEKAITIKVLRHRPHPARTGFNDHKYPIAVAESASAFEYMFTYCYKIYRPIIKSLIEKEVLSPHTAYLPYRLGWMDGNTDTLFTALFTTLYNSATPYLTATEIETLDHGRRILTEMPKAFRQALTIKAESTALKDIDTAMFNPRHIVKYLLSGTATDELNGRITLPQLIDMLDILFVAYGGLSAHGQNVLPETITRLEKVYCLNPTTSLKGQPLFSTDRQGKNGIPIRDVFSENNIDRASNVCDLLQYITTKTSGEKNYATSGLYLAITAVPYWYKRRYVTAETFTEEIDEPILEEPIKTGPTVYETCLETARTALISIDKSDSAIADIETIFKAMDTLSRNLGENISNNMRRSCENLYVPETITTLRRYIQITKEKNAPEEPITELRGALKTAAKLFTKCTAMRNEYADISIASDARVAQKLMKEALSNIE